MSESQITDAEVLAVLTKKWQSTSQVGTRTKFSDLARLRRILSKLKEDGILERDRIGADVVWRLTKSTSKEVQKVKEEIALSLGKISAPAKIRKQIKKIGNTLYKDITKGNFPQLEIPSRGTKNIRFDPRLRQYVLADRTHIRSAAKLNQIRSLSQQIWVMRFVKTLLDTDKSSTLRDVYYHSFGNDIHFEAQNESDDIITDVEALLRIP
ncbi:MAG: hypothetical protein ACW976_03460, partial [Candidatus Ranarchaeia archaeon]